MSWDVLVLNTGGVPLAAGLDDVELPPLGSAAEVRERLSTSLPGIDWSDPSWGMYDGDTFSFEFNIGEDDPLDHMMLHVRGAGDVVPTIIAIIRAHGWSAFDCSMGEFLDLENPSAGWEGFQAFRQSLDELS